MFKIFFFAAVLLFSSFAFADFEIVTSNENQKSEIYRVNSATGEAWYFAPQNRRWIKTQEQKPLKNSEYKFTLTCINILLRIDPESGDSWFLTDDFRWLPIHN